jgi:ATP-dependent Clp protease ATP-binding subunit ClpA
MEEKKLQFTDMATEAIQNSQQIVQQMNHGVWDIEHILYALVVQEKGFVGDILKELRVDSNYIKAELNSAFGRMPKVSQSGPIMQPPAISRRIQEVFEAADAEAKRLKDNLISTEIIFLSIAGEGKGTSYNILQKFGIDREKVY